MIQIFTRSRYNHAFVILDAEKGTILEAQPSGSRINNISEYAGCPMVFSPDVVLGGNLDALAIAGEGFTGIPYGFLDILYIGLATLGFRWKWLLNRVIHSPDEICSQLVAQFGVAYGAKSWQCGQADPQLVTPAMLAKRAEAQG